MKLRLKITIHGAVQGVGFRPFVFRLASQMGLTGWVNNSSEGVFIEVEGARNDLEDFLSRLESEKPPRSFIQSLEASWLDVAGYTSFEIRQSEPGGAKSAIILPDLGTCADCLMEIFDPANRRFQYPFTNCTHCGPRFSIIEALPYDRANSSMKRFRMCPECQAEYENPADRRFHAQPNACPVCGPKLELWDAVGRPVRPGLQEAKTLEDGAQRPNDGSLLEAAVKAIKGGAILAVKGLGGFHLMAAAGNDRAVQTLRERKHRVEKPFAVMFPSLESVHQVCRASRLEERLLKSPEAPIVLLARQASDGSGAVSTAVAPGNPNLGVMLPYTPLHHLLLAKMGSPLVATSGNLSDEPICIDEQEAVQRLSGIADFFLVHNRPIVRHVDDSIVRVMAGRELVLRRARGYAPLPIQIRDAENSAGSGTNQDLESKPKLETILAVGAHLKNAVALASGWQIFISQHIGDLESAQAFDAFQRVASDFQSLYDSPAERVAADGHPDYLSTRFAKTSGLPCTTVQHHVAHVLSCMGENEICPPALGVSWDGTGYGLDGTIWGGEFFRIHKDGAERVAYLRRFRLPGGEQAIKEPRRAALGLLFESVGEAAFESAQLVPGAFSSSDLATLRTMLLRNLNSPWTSSAGRLFDGVASLMGMRQRASFEGQAAMELEFLIGDTQDSGAYELVSNKEPIPVLDWRPAIQAIVTDVRAGVAPSLVSARFHNMLVESIVTVARQTGLERVVLSGGCFQNRYLTEHAIQRLRAEGFRPYWHQRIPPNDGGICRGKSLLRAGGRCRLGPMCLAIPGKVTTIQGEDPLMRIGKIDFGGVLKEASLAYVPDAKIGDYVIVHAGFAISRLDEEEAGKVFEYLKEMQELSELDEDHPAGEST